MSFDLLQLQSLATAETGNAFATYELGRSGGVSSKGLTDLAAALPLIPLGKVSPEQLGVIAAELEASKSSVPTTNTQLLDQVGSLIALVSNSQASATGGLETADQAILVQIGSNVASGIANAVGFAAGKASVTNPAPSAS